MAKDPVSVSAISVAGLIASTALLTNVWLTANPFVHGWQPNQPIYVILVLVMFSFSLSGIWSTIRRS